MTHTNIHYVSALIYSSQDTVGIQGRLEWFRPLLTTGLPMTLFVDSHYYKALFASPWFHAADHPDLNVIPWELEHSETWRLCCSGETTLPENRNPKKDNVFFMALMNAKTELVARVAAEATAPFIAFLDAGIGKIFRRPAESFARLRGARIRKGVSGMLVPGCWAPAPASRETLAKKICWTFCGGFFVVPREEAAGLAKAAMNALSDFVANGKLTWEVNVWVHMMCLANAPTVNWFKADHDDSMTAIPEEYLEIGDRPPG